MALYYCSKSMRTLLKENYYWIKKIYKSPLENLIYTTKCKITIKDINFLETFLKYAELSLLYRGSRDGWLAIDFHSRCDIKGATLTLI